MTAVACRKTRKRLILQVTQSLALVLISQGLVKLRSFLYRSLIRRPPTCHTSSTLVRPQKLKPKDNLFIAKRLVETHSSTEKEGKTAIKSTNPAHAHHTYRLTTTSTGNIAHH